MRTLALAFILLGATVASAQQIDKKPLPGVTNYARLETTIACAGAIKAEEAVPAIEKEGFAAIINLREASEPGANIEQEAMLAKNAGLKYFHVPFNGAKPTTEAADAFIAAITTPGTEPAFIHCSGGNRAATMWMIKRMVVDHWDVERATKEAQALGQTSAPLREFAVNYAKAHGK